MKTKTPSKLEKILSQGHLAVTSECGPPRGSDPAVIVKKANLIKDHVDAINVTDNQTAMTRLCSLASVIHLKLMGLEPRCKVIYWVQHHLISTTYFAFPGITSASGTALRPRMFMTLTLCS